MTSPDALPRMTRMKSNTGIARRLLLATLLTLCTASALPQSPALYTVEIVVFRNGSDAAALPAAGANASTITPAASGDVEATPVAASKLVSAAAKLRNRSSGFRVLAHSAWTQSPAGWNSRRGVSATQLGLAGGITGKVILERGQYLHFGVDLTIEDGGKRYHIDEVRQVKPNQIHYLDHPAVGVLAIVTATTG
jgi:hypothetical protein